MDLKMKMIACYDFVPLLDGPKNTVLNKITFRFVPQSNLKRKVFKGKNIFIIVI